MSLVLPSSLLLAGGVRAQSPDLLPPLQRDIAPSATFGALSPGRVHPGIDLPTSGQRRLVAAVSDGEIVRVRVSGGGYGRALHMALGDGREIVYAHLSRFAPAIEESCRAIQGRSGLYNVDWIPPAGLFAVLRGAWVGWTGETEDGRSLLHLEVRVGGVPRNPLTNGLSWPDGTPPRIAAVGLVPLGPAARIDGKLEEREISVAHHVTGAGPGATMVLWGPVGITCESWDESAGQRCSPFRVCLDVDGVRSFCAEVGTRLGAGGWRDDSPEPAEPVRFLQPLYDPNDGDRGGLACGTRLAPGLHRLRVISADYAANADTVDLVALVQPTPRVEEWMARPSRRGEWDLAVRVGSLGSEDPERIRLWVDLTEDGRRFPVRTLLGHVGSGWFLGTVSALVPAGGIGVRMRLQTQTGLESWQAAQSMDPGGLCGEAAIDSPVIGFAPRWISLVFPNGCLSSKPPVASLAIDGRRTPCELLEVPPEEGEGPAWRFAAPARGGRAGSAPEVELTLDGRVHRWEIKDVFLATPRSDLRWTSGDSALTVEIAAGTFYRPVWLGWMRTRQDDGLVSRGISSGAETSSPEQEEVLFSRSDLHAIAPADAEMDGPFRVSLRPRRAPETGEEIRRLMVFGRRGDASPWEPRGGLWNGKAIVAVVDRLEEWIVMEDRSEPWVYGLDPAPGSRRTAPIAGLRAQIREEGSGISSSGLQVWLDGRRIPAEWSPRSRSLGAEIPGSLYPGEHSWEVRATDRAGNQARRIAGFTVVDRP